MQCGGRSRIVMQWRVMYRLLCGRVFDGRSGARAPAIAVAARLKFQYALLGEWRRVRPERASVGI
eukprot:10786431-Lingulodinium_polyedra.AAC.1